MITITDSLRRPIFIGILEISFMAFSRNTTNSSGFSGLLSSVIGIMIDVSF